MVGSNLLSPFFLLLLFFFSSSFLLQTPPHLSLNHCHLSHSVSHLLNIPVQVQHPDYQHLQTHTLPLLTHPPAVPALPPSKGSCTSLSKHVPLFWLCVCISSSSRVTWSRQRKWHICSAKLIFPFFHFSPKFPPPPIPWFRVLGSCLGMACLWP